MKVKLQRIISVLLVALFCVSLITISAPVAFAAEDLGVLSDMRAVDDWNSAFNPLLSDSLGITAARCWDLLDSCMSAAGWGSVDSVASLEAAASRFNSRLTLLKGSVLYAPFGAAFTLWNTKAVVTYVPSEGVYRLIDDNTNIMLVNKAGYYPYYCESAVALPDDHPDDVVVSTRSDRWVDFSTAVWSDKVVVLNSDTLSSLCATLNSTDRYCRVATTFINDSYMNVIVDDGTKHMYCNYEGYPYVASIEPTVTDVKYDYIVNDNGDTIDNSQVIDMTNGTFNFIDETGKSEFMIENLIYDFTTKSYSADTYNITYDTTNNSYYTYNYTWNITYNITNTYVTNIGQSAEYEPMELYYELPDGRSSADLTAAEVAGMSFEFADCVNYAKSATDTYIRALYHFDGDTSDSSYFSTQGNFEWTKGASIAYMDSGAFDGALYLGPESHAFTITLPSNIGSGDFTVQFRYYQAGAADTQSNIENSLSIGGSAVLKWDEAALYNGSGTALTSLAIGTWQELAVIRNNGILYLYHNGICVGSSSNTSAWSGTISLSLGDTSRAYSMLDELRVLNFAFAESGGSYTCTSVPYDTNAVLVLPDSAFPIADEYWEINSSYDNILSQYGMDDWTGSKPSLPSYFYSWTMPISLPDNGTKMYSFPYFYYGCDIFSHLSYDDGFVFNRNVTSSSLHYQYTLVNGSFDSRYSTSSYLFWHPYMNGYSFYMPTYGFYSLLMTKIGNIQALPSGQYTFSLVNNSGEVSSVTFNLGKVSSESYGTSASVGCTAYTQQAFGYEFGLLRLFTHEYSNGTFTNAWYLVVNPIVDNPEPIMYMELVEGDSTDLTAEWVTCMYSSDVVQPNTAAIQTDIPVNGYTVGGVRPTFPARGDVWFPVTGNRITGCYIYTGSMWESCNARYYTGTRWIPIYAFDIVTLQDCWDIADVDNVIVQIGTEAEFWNWWKEAWIDFRSWLSGAITGSSGSGSSLAPGSVKDSLSDALSSLVEGVFSVITEALKSLIGAAGDLLSGIFSFFSDTVLGGISGFFSSITDGSLFEGFQQTDENGNTTTGLPDGIASVFAFFSGLFMVMPGELRMIMLFGIGLFLLLAVFKVIKS